MYSICVIFYGCLQICARLVSSQEEHFYVHTVASPRLISSWKEIFYVLVFHIQKKLYFMLKRNVRKSSQANRKSSQEYPANAWAPQATFLVLHFSYYTLMTFLMMLSLKLLSMVMILLSTQNTIRHLICSNH